MLKSDQLLLEALKASLKNEEVNWEDGITAEDWAALFAKAEEHSILPLIFEAVYACPAALLIKDNIIPFYKRKVLNQVMVQTMKTGEFLTLNKQLQQVGIKPLVVKGIICRNLYPKPDHRISGDEDVLINPEEFQQCHKAMIQSGMYLLRPEQDIEKEYEVPYGKRQGSLYIELHKSLFPPESEAYGELNTWFADVFACPVAENIEGVPVYTMEYTDHLFYLICHAFKHFLHSGFGIRQVCDIIMMANAYGSEIDWTRILKQTKAMHADVFAAALFRIGEKYLVFNPEKACYPKIWREMHIDETTLLEDLLSGGVYGSADNTRLHSSTITLQAVAAQKNGKKAKGNALKSIFPSLKDMQGKYQYLNKYPILLPIAWVNRIFKYWKEMKASGNIDLTKSMKIGEQRVELLKKYGIIK